MSKPLQEVPPPPEGHLEGCECDGCYRSRYCQGIRNNQIRSCGAYQQLLRKQEENRRKLWAKIDRSGHSWDEL